MANPIRIFLDFLEQLVFGPNSGRYAAYLRKKGATVGEGTKFYGKPIIDLTRPCLVEIGRNCVFTDDVRILTHGFDWSVLREKYGEMLASAGKVVIEDNVFIGMSAIILKGVRIGKNTVIGAGSVVTHNIPPNSVAAGNPCRVVMTIDEYYRKRKEEYVEEAKAYAFELYRKTSEVPRQKDFWDEFPIFFDRSKKLEPKFREQLGSSLENFLKTKQLYPSFEEFLVASGIPRSAIKKNGLI
jgi:acetyltransferase-like isoleucine patch superfamily enzyme